MEKEGHLAKVTQPTDLVNSMVVAQKGEKIRICIDPSDLNKAIKREHYPSKTVEEITTKIPGAEVFSVLDAKSGYLQMKIDYESSLLTTMNTPLGRYRWLKLPFGIKSAPEMYQRAMDDMLEGIKYAYAIMDDILIAGRDVAHHDAVLRQVLDRAQSCNLKLNFDKENAFQRIKDLCCTAPILSYYDVKKDAKIQCDASKNAVGAVLLQEGKTIAYESRKLRTSELNWSPIEKEMLAIVFSTGKFREYILGKETVVQTDHKPLETMFRKPLLSAPLRLQTMMLKVKGYDLKVEYLPGKKQVIADTLSRASLKSTCLREYLSRKTNTRNCNKELRMSCTICMLSSSRATERTDDAEQDSRLSMGAEAASDIFTFKSKNYVLSVDYYSKYIKFTELNDLSAFSTIEALKGHFERHGIPERLTTDCGTQYTSVEFKNFAKAYNF
ncbi:Retrovirus-related Pol poly from transposon [Paramuricea clavata]|uniref:Retrovirus-related Pol poly from transposon n=1 Tax=Paramuricea clavata TaxID=317549 RepID=A0A7D9LC36_PARCT|nr:Retrovirus-related Pol poly from transposon [Paramuricea clavata]